MLTIRLQRAGSKNRPKFRIVLAEKARSASKKFQEVLGHYNPRSKEFGVKDEERLKYWIAKHVQLSPTVHNLLVEKKLVEGKKVKAWSAKKSEVASDAQAAPAAATPSIEGASVAPKEQEVKAEESKSEPAPKENPQA
jgi:small subunit ribosomal protein S16